MSDKDLYVVIAEMLRKQEQQSKILERIDTTLNEFMRLTLKQFEQQQIFNENFLSTQNKMSMLLERVVDRMEGLENRFDHIENRFDDLEKRFDDFSIQTNTNFSLIAERLSGIESKLN